jgi:hypothetical protein
MRVLIFVLLTAVVGRLEAKSESNTEEGCPSPCGCGWSHYSDFRHTEGHDSCVMFFPAISGSTNPWQDSKTACENHGGHLLTFASGKMGLPAFAADLIPVDAHGAFVGCTQMAAASNIARDWSWIDGTDTTNLNCGPEGGFSGCGVWSLGEPKYVDLVLLRLRDTGGSVTVLSGVFIPPA